MLPLSIRNLHFSLKHACKHEMFMEVFETPIIFFFKKLDTYLQLQFIEKAVKISYAI